MKFLNKLFKIFGNTLIKIIIVFALIAIPAITLAYKLHYPRVFYGWEFFIFICLLAIERTWETFYSSQERRRHKLYGEWTLPLVSIAYIMLVLGVILEFFLLPREINILTTFCALCVFILSFFFRLWGMRSLKDQWSVHAIGAKKVKEVFLIKSGPYKYIRHPIYIGVALEVLSIPLIWNTYFMFIFACLVNIPLQIMRGYFEEKTSIKKLGEEYRRYKKDVPAFLPLKLLMPKRKWII